LVSAPWIIKNLHNEGKYYCDSITMKWFARLKGFQVERISGVSVAEKILKLENSLILGSGDDIKLPFWRSIENVELTEEILDTIDDHKNIIIGISSPKQDQLALLINEKYPNVNIYCLGAAISNPHLQNSFVDKYSITWLILFIMNPKRFIIKLKNMMKNTLILLRKSSHDQCLELIESFETDNSRSKSK
jgi:hypothetical protein